MAVPAWPEQGMLAAPSTGPAAAKKSAADLLTDDYLARLLSYSVDAIRKEPAALKSQSEALKQEIHDTALTHYQGFIEAASCFKQISAHVKKLKEELGSLTVCLDSLQDEASSFRTTAQRYKASPHSPCPETQIKKRHSSRHLKFVRSGGSGVVPVAAVAPRHHPRHPRDPSTDRHLCP